MLYSFKERFVPMVKEGSKRQTVRAYRKDGQLPKVGNLVHNYYGLRTKHVQKLMDPVPCRDARTIFIFPDGDVFLSKQVITKVEAEDMLQISSEFKKTAERTIFLSLSDCTPLSSGLKDSFAWKDGFRPDNKNVGKSTGAFDLMLRFWKQTHQLPFVGTVTYW